MIREAPEAWTRGERDRGGKGEVPDSVPCTKKGKEKA